MDTKQTQLIGKIDVVDEKRINSKKRNKSK
jgi:hypothetical protein